MELPGIEPGAFHMRSERSTTELQPPQKPAKQYDGWAWKDKNPLKDTFISSGLG